MRKTARAKGIVSNPLVAQTASGGSVPKNSAVQIVPSDESLNSRLAKRTTLQNNTNAQPNEEIRDHTGGDAPNHSRAAIHKVHRKFVYPSTGGSTPRLKRSPSPWARFCRHWWPFLLLASVRSRRARVALAASLIARRHPVGVLDDLAYSVGLGVLRFGAWRRRAAPVRNQTRRPPLVVVSRSSNASPVWPASRRSATSRPIRQPASREPRTWPSRA